MGIKRMLRKGLAVAVILLFIGVALAPSINSSVIEDELVEFDVEFCGLGKKHTVQLTQQEADEVDQLFEDIEQQLSLVETRAETEEIFKDAIVELDRYGLLGGLSVKQIQHIISRRYKHFQTEKIIVSDYISNYFCLIAGKANYVEFYSLAIQIWAFLSALTSYSFPSLIRSFFFYRSMSKPIIWASYIVTSYSSEGWLFSIGLNGIKHAQGPMIGQIPFRLEPDWERYASVSGFTGIKIIKLTDDNLFTGTHYYIGTAYRVDVKEV